MPETRCAGRTASPGVAIGTLFVLQSAIHRVRGLGTPAEEGNALDGAIAAAMTELAELIAQTEGEASEILTFQVAMLEDEELTAPARAEIAGGSSADLAWRTALEPLTPEQRRLVVDTLTVYEREVTAGRRS